MGSKQGSLWQSQKMDHNSSYKSPILVIQNLNINFTDANTISMKETSPISPFFPTEKSVPKSGQYVGSFSHHMSIQYNTWCNNQIFSKYVSTKCHPPAYGQILDSEISIESKDVKIGVRMRKIWSFKVGGLKECKVYAIAPKPTQFRTQGCSFEVQSCNSVLENIMGSYCTPNFNPKQLLKHALTLSQLKPQNRPPKPSELKPQNMP